MLNSFAQQIQERSDEIRFKRLIEAINEADLSIYQNNYQRAMALTTLITAIDPEMAQREEILELVSQIKRNSDEAIAEDVATTQNPPPIAPGDVNQAIVQAEHANPAVPARQPLDPNVRLAIDMAIALTAIYFVPGMFCTYASGELMKVLFLKLVGTDCPKTRMACTFLLPFFAKGYTPKDLMLNNYTHLQEEYGSIASLAAPAGVLLYKKGPAIANTCLEKCAEKTRDITTAASDFFNLMYGHADEEVLERNQGSWATKDIGEFASDVVGSIKHGGQVLWGLASWPMKALAFGKAHSQEQTPKLDAPALS